MIVAVGPYVPVLAATLLIRRMAGGGRPDRVVYQCSGLTSLDEFGTLFDRLGMKRNATRTGKRPNLREAA